jgi:Sec-independent protein secretion pathway component TatC
MERFQFGKSNKIILSIAVILTIIGYIIMGTGDSIISPIILVISYVILFPLGIMIGFMKKNKE